MWPSILKMLTPHFPAVLLGYTRLYLHVITHYILTSRILTPLLPEEGDSGEVLASQTGSDMIIRQDVRPVASEGIVVVMGSVYNSTSAPQSYLAGAHSRGQFCHLEQLRRFWKLTMFTLMDTVLMILLGRHGG